MYNTNIPSDRELPSTSKLIKSTILAAIVAVILLITVVIPSEYGIDPTGFGEITGLKRMGEIKISLAREADAELNSEAEGKVEVVEVEVAELEVAELEVTKVEVTETLEIPPVTKISNKPYQNHEMTFTLAPDEAAEVKVTMKKGAKVDYIWQTDGGKSNFDVHGDSKKLQISYHPYYKGTDSKREGTLTAAFDGGHGWFWRNRTNKLLTITIKTAGEYTDIKRY
jgi:predicted component of type VI protein secretion system